MHATQPCLRRANLRDEGHQRTDRSKRYRTSAEYGFVQVEGYYEPSWPRKGQSVEGICSHEGCRLMMEIRTSNDLALRVCTKAPILWPRLKLWWLPLNNHQRCWSRSLRDSFRAINQSRGILPQSRSMSSVPVSKIMPKSSRSSSVQDHPRSSKGMVSEYAEHPKPRE